MSDAALESCAKALIHDVANSSISEKTRCCFVLKGLDTNRSRQMLVDAFYANSDSELLQHEICYILGQMGHSESNGVLSEILLDAAMPTVVRHEAAEALGAIGDPASLPLLQRVAGDDSLPEAITQTASLAVSRIVLLQQQQQEDGQEGKKETIPSSVYSSVDPAPPMVVPTDCKDPVGFLAATYCDTTTKMFTRYRAMFALRDIGSDEAVEVLCRGLEDTSALFRHEVAYVCGQIQNATSLPALSRSLRNDSSAMVRHEAAEAIGSLGVNAQVLHDYVGDSSTMVAESCEVALDINDYQASDAFQYAEVKK